MGLTDRASAAWITQRDRREAEAKRRQKEAEAEARRRQEEAETEARRKRDVTIAALRAQHEEPASKVMAEWAARLRVTPQDVTVDVDSEAKRLFLRWKADGNVFCVIGSKHGLGGVLIEREIPESDCTFLVRGIQRWRAGTLEEIGYALSYQAIRDRHNQKRENLDVGGP